MTEIVSVLSRIGRDFTDPGWICVVESNGSSSMLVFPDDLSWEPVPYPGDDGRPILQWRRARQLDWAIKSNLALEVEVTNRWPRPAVPYVVQEIVRVVAPPLLAPEVECPECGAIGSPEGVRLGECCVVGVMEAMPQSEFDELRGWALELMTANQDNVYRSFTSDDCRKLKRLIQELEDERDARRKAYELLSQRELEILRLRKQVTT